MNLIGNINAIPFRRFRGGGGVVPFPSIPGMIARYSALGLTNEEMSKNPVWVDKTGNGHDLQMKNFAWDGMSGCDGYTESFLGDTVNWESEIYNSRKMSVFGGDRSRVSIIHNQYHFQTYVKISGINDNEGKVRGVYFYNIESSFTEGTLCRTDGIYKIDITGSGKSKVVAIWAYPAKKNEEDYDYPVTIEILPLYSGALVFDGVDDYGVCNNFPILTKGKGYTVVALRQWIEEKNSITALASNSKNWNQDGAFVFEYNNLENNYPNLEISFGSNTNLGREKSSFTYQTSKLYNGNLIESGSFLGSDKLVVAKANENLSPNSNAAIWELVFLDHDATEEELTKIKDYFVKTYPWLFPDQAWTVVGKTNEDEDRATIANITGNGNDLVLSNFGFAEGSGYGLYAQNYISYAITNRAVYTKTNSSIHVTKSITAGVNFTESARNVTIPSYRIKVTGIQSGQEMIYRGSNNTFLTNIPSDGIYVLPAVENGSNLGFQFVLYTGDCDITIEQIPEYEGYLVTDGVDDEVRSAAFTLNEDWTIVGNWEFITNENKNAGLTKVYSFYLYNRDYGIFVYEYLNAGQGFSVEDVKSLKAICSDGRIYLNDWQEIRNNIEQEATISKGVMAIGYFNRDFTKMAFKNLGIYNNQLLSKDDCIKAYNYLQTLKAK